VVLPIASVVFDFEFGIGAIADDNELGQAADDVIGIHETGFDRDTRKRNVAAFKQQAISGSGLTLGEFGPDADQVLVSHVELKVLLLFQHLVRESQESGFKALRPVIVGGLGEVGDVGGDGSQFDHSIQSLDLGSS